MKIAITSTGAELNSAVEPQFGRCAYFALVDTESGAFEAKANPFRDAAVGRAGIQAARWVIEQGVGALLTGHCGPKSVAVLDDADIRVVENVAGTVRETVAHYTPVSQAVAQPKLEPRPRGRRQGCRRGLGAGQGRGRGRSHGPGTGQDQGWGQGRGRGQGRNQGQDQSESLLEA